MTDANEASAREELHLRRIEMRGFRRRDGLFEVEGRIIDTKPHDFVPRGGGVAVPAGSDIHNIALTLVFDEAMVVRDVRTETLSAPYGECPAAGLIMRDLIGLTMGAGWNSEARKRLAAADRCTHMVELLGPMATTAIQSLSAERAGLPEPVDSNGRPLKIGSCFAYSPARELVRRRWPQFYDPAGSDQPA